MRASIFRFAVLFVVASLSACAEQAAPRPPVPGPPVQLSVTGGNGQVAPAGSPLPAPIVVTAMDADGAPSPGAMVEWQAEGGRLQPLASVTDARGQVEARWDLGPSVGPQRAVAQIPGLVSAEIIATAEPPEEPDPVLEPLVPLSFETYDGSGQAVHPDFAATPADAFGVPLHLAITPYPGSNPAFENPSLFGATREDNWSLGVGTPNPVVLPSAGYLSDPDIVWEPDAHELWMYYRQVAEGDNIVLLVRSADGRSWSEPVEVARAPNHSLVSPSVVRRGAGDWWMFSVNAGPGGCEALTTTVEVRRSADGRQWSAPETTDLKSPELWAWHVDVQWIPEHQEFWALFNGKAAGGCNTPALFIARSTDAHQWATMATPVLVRGVAPALQHVVYRGTFAYDAATDMLTLWVSGARFEDRKYHWSTLVTHRSRAALFAVAKAQLTEAALTPYPEPLGDWP